MKKVEIIKLVNAGILSMTAHNLKPAQAYKAFKLKREVEKAFKEIQEEQDAIKKDNGLTDEKEEKAAKIVDKINVGTSVSEDERQFLLSNNEDNRKIASLFKEANKAEVSLDLKTIPYEDWRILQAENKEKTIGNNKVDILGGEAEIILEGIFWDAPVEDGK